MILDSDLADIYGVEVRTLNQQVKRNADRFPEDFSFMLTKSPQIVYPLVLLSLNVHIIANPCNVTL